MQRSQTMWGYTRAAVLVFIGCFALYGCAGQPTVEPAESGPLPSDQGQSATVTESVKSAGDPCDVKQAVSSPDTSTTFGDVVHICGRYTFTQEDVDKLSSSSNEATIGEFVARVFPDKSGSERNKLEKCIAHLLRGRSTPWLSGLFAGLIKDIACT